MDTELSPEDHFELFGDFDIEANAAEAESRWGDTDSWEESKRRISKYSKGQWKSALADQQSARWPGPVHP